ncbi:MAG: response regulator [Oscillospiraceae bacterium]|nr:response regulator [Oscillospiraceae bacterium]
MYKILIADDESTVLKGLSEFMPWDSVQCMVAATAKDGHEAIELIKNDSPDIVITDIKMPRKSGIDVAKFVHENYPKIKVIILTGFAEFEYARSALIYGVSNYELKPVSKNKLLDAVRELTAKIDIERGYSEKVNPLVKKALRFISENYSTNLSLETVASAIAVNPSHLSRTFKKETGEVITDYINHIRIEKAKELLALTDMLVYEAAEAVGFNDPAYFSIVFKKNTGISPKDFKDGATATQS